MSDLKNGLWYFNIHTTTHPNGEIRGQILPEPHATPMLAAGVVLLALIARRRSRGER